jgi:tetratricopeptide (TPR) repeat protein
MAELPNPGDGLVNQAQSVIRNARFRVLTWLTLVGMLPLLALGMITTWRRIQIPPALDEICVLAREGQFERSQQLLAHYLRVNPRDNRALLLMAQFAMDRPDPQPERALEHLDRIHSVSVREAAIVRFSQGKAYYQKKRYDLAEGCWREALDLDWLVPEAGWALIDLLDFESRSEEAHQLGMRLYKTEPDPRDQIRLLLEMVRLDIDRVAPGSQIQVFESAWNANPDYIPLAVTLGLALVHDSRASEGIEILQDNLRRHPDSSEAWDGWLTGLDDGFQTERLKEEFARLPQPLREDPRFAKHEGTVAQGMKDWTRAAAAYRRAFAHEPFNGVVLYKLRMALRSEADSAEFKRIDQALQTYQSAFKQLRGVHSEALAAPSLGIEPHPDIYHRLATLREEMGRFDEARAWHQLVLRDKPGEPLSLAALARLK